MTTSVCDFEKLLYFEQNLLRFLINIFQNFVMFLNVFLIHFHTGWTVCSFLATGLLLFTCCSLFVTFCLFVILCSVLFNFWLYSLLFVCCSLLSPHWLLIFRSLRVHGSLTFSFYIFRKQRYLSELNVTTS